MLASDRRTGTAAPGRRRAAAVGGLPPVYGRRHYLTVAVVLAVIALAGAGNTGNMYQISVFNTALTASVATVGLYFAYQLGGMFAFSQAAFMGIGAYTSAILTPEHGFVFAAGVALIVAAVLAYLLAFLLRDAKHMYFAIGAMAFAEIAVLVFRNWEVTAGPTGGGMLYGIAPPSVAGYEFATSGQIFWFLLAVLGVVLLLSVLLERSPLRRHALAVKAIPQVTESNGIDPRRSAMTLFTYGSTLGALAGVLQAHSLGTIAPEAFEVGVAINLYLMLLLGGVGSMWGGVAGAFFLTWLPEFLRPVKEYETVVYSLLLLATIVLFPNGIVGGVAWLAGKVRHRRRGGGRSSGVTTHA
ncbi:branched-chain amino acid ABC transporter permease [Thermopolyspora flexuosa]|uniref:Amino acid/amide ABC transporter membrane protein 2 (HAAT family) n=1 Tax=Thermopolyspora flexuosa TaxID=103836 RepID=A0A543J4H3_9ACTN|nr:branched-chain amino acid ABC transporter permease [Thermopolyspora flexuosa]TQM77735.1 amino acid/amide ABC transporter membrane protein 2 (HAAT family) [Thermopolyspora flexuosa]GGM71060.1 branched-chain amino acid ABC transporter permease [Thermopolyspora flexuosa]